MWQHWKYHLNCDWVSQLQCKQAAPGPLCMFVYTRLSYLCNTILIFCVLWYYTMHCETHMHIYAINTQTHTSTHTHAHISWRKAGWASLHCVHFMFACADFIKASKHSVYGASGSNISAFTRYSLLQNSIWSFHVGTCCSKQCSVYGAVCAVNKQTEDWGSHPASVREKQAYAGSLSIWVFAYLSIWVLDTQILKQTENWGSHPATQPASVREKQAYAGSLETTWHSFSLHKCHRWAKKRKKLNVFFRSKILLTLYRGSGLGRFKEDIGLHRFEANLMIRFHHLEGWVNAHFDLI